MKFYEKYILLALTIYLFIGVSVLRLAQDDNLKIVTCDVGQGDAILLIYQKTQVLVDGGPNNKVLDCLSRHVPFWDRTIEIVVNTHPEADHATGLVDVLERYKVDNFVKNADTPSTQTYRLLEGAVKANGSRVIVNPEKLRVGGGVIQIDVLKNKSQKPRPPSGGLNLNSLVLLVKYRNFEALLTADIEPPRTEAVVEDLKKLAIDWPIEYIKVPHHGSKNGLTRGLLELAKPEVAVISVGKNQWGHPNIEVLEMLKVAGVKVLRTDQCQGPACRQAGVVWKVSF